MKIILTSIGTRGDIEPFLAIGEILKEKGHQVICAFSERYRELTKSCNLEFASLGKKGDDLLESDAARTLLGGSGIKRFFALINLFKLASNEKGAVKEKDIKLCELVKQERPDRIVYHLKSNYPVIWECKNRGKTILVSPFPYLHYVKGHSLFFGKNYGEFLNKLSYKLFDFGAVTAAIFVKKMLQINDKITLKQLKNIIHNRKFIYAISPSLFPLSGHRESNVKTLGHQELKSKSDWKPEKKLTDFIEKHEKTIKISNRKF